MKQRLRTIPKYHGMTLRDFNKYYSTSRRNFLARGGSLVPAVMHAFSRDQTEVEAFEILQGEPVNVSEGAHEDLRRAGAVVRRYDGILSQLSEAYRKLDPETAKMASQNSRLDCEWFQESYRSYLLP